ncbi:hypothetical protein LCGC14_0806760 [marine sediment metagenome]|uniref:Alkyl hydroperoxide reductase subunit C/ Thiol specific antioxidant domain-containing protein n=1 Tax=marine sediment metagenome TaxID=412755 RepID=A0A0F9SV96_9ZZZZ|nr:MAG: Thiol-disulfide oxidoreductase ResA [Candidatus Lokiarchaeum sp. GC14_75]
MNRKKFFKRESAVGFIFLGIILIGMVIGISFSILNSENIENPTNYTFETIGGETIDLADQKGKIVIIYFHFLECSWCAITTPLLAKIEDDYSNNSLYIITITIELVDTNGELNNWRSNHNATWDLVRDDIDHSIGSRYDISITPTTLIYDKNGNLIIKLLGITNFNSTVRSKIDTHL